MARAKKKHNVRKAARQVAEASATAAGNVLGEVAAARSGPSSGGNAAVCLRLARMCDEAADHMARAQEMLTGDVDDGETAISHMDAALECLNRLAEEGERHIAERERAVKTA